MPDYPNNLTFADFAGKKTYTCKKCSKELRYAKFFKSDGTMLTMDGKIPDGKYDKTTNVFSTSILANTKELHTCYKIEWPKGDNRGNTVIDPDGTVGHNSQPLTELDNKVMHKIIDDAHDDAQLEIFVLEGVEKACKEMGIELGPVSGMIFKEVCENIRRRNERGE